MKDMLGYIMCHSNNFIAADQLEFNTSRKFFKEWFVILSNQLQSREFLQLKVLEVLKEKDAVMRD